MQHDFGTIKRLVDFPPFGTNLLLYIEFDQLVYEFNPQHFHYYKQETRYLIINDLIDVLTPC